jgi:phosphatidylglycerophosphate synthase
MLSLCAIGSNPTLLWGLSNNERLRRIAASAGYRWEDASMTAHNPQLLINLAHVCDPTLIKLFADRPGEALTLDGELVLVHARNASEADAVKQAMLTGAPPPPSLQLHAHENGLSATNSELRKRETPFALRLTPATVAAAERASYYGAYKGVTDILTKYLWPEWALALTRLAARMNISPNMVTAVGGACCVLAFWLFWLGHYWAGMAVGLVFMVLDTVDGKLARCTITSSWWGNVFDHGIDLVHPPFWWWAWGIGLTTYGLPFSAASFTLILLAIVVGYIAQRVIEGIFIRRYGFHIHVWHKLDSDFRLITARRNPNMVILLVSMLFARPDLGLLGIAWWTMLSLGFHGVRLIQAEQVFRRAGKLTSWL